MSSIHKVARFVKLLASFNLFSRPFPTFSLSGFTHSIFRQMTTVTILNFIRRITRPPPVIDARQPLTLNVIRTLDALRSMSHHLLRISFRNRYIIIKPEWPCIWLWLVALLKPFCVFTDSSENSDTKSRCILEVFSFLNSIASPNTTPIADPHCFISKLTDSSESIPLMANIWLLSFRTKWPWMVHQAVTQFLIVFAHTTDGSASIEAFGVAVIDACPQSDLLSTWSTAIVDINGRPLPLDSDPQLITATQGLLLAETTLFFQPLPTLDIIHTTLTHAYKLWSRCLATPFGDVYLENLHLLSVSSLARFSLQLISGGPDWIVKSLDSGLLHLVARTLAWMHSLPDLESDQSIYVIFEGIIRMVLYDSAYRRILRGFRHNLKKIQFQNLEGYLSAGRLSKLWEDITSEALSPDARNTRAICFQTALRTVCSSEKVGAVFKAISYVLTLFISVSSSFSTR
ncbi:MAG: hypothetical protein NXY57DRAFT_958693 [Lentinula lateritia]|nr:MAG: hypothetical protein NXY57DRAFT_958693 [Lentinula lateritia]